MADQGGFEHLFDNKADALRVVNGEAAPMEIRGAIIQMLQRLDEGGYEAYLHKKDGVPTESVRMTDGRMIWVTCEWDYVGGMVSIRVALRP
jgi:hypothetical protein